MSFTTTVSNDVQEYGFYAIAVVPTKVISDSNIDAAAFGSSAYIPTNHKAG
jgi:hypothetical protein